MITEESKDDQPPIPEGWTRCHAYLKRKKRFCRQQKDPGSIFCGNHAESKDWIPCPIDPSHRILRDQLEKHIKICPKLRVEREQASRFYFSKDINCGGCGKIVNECTPRKSTMERALVIARKVLEINKSIFGFENKSIENISEEDIHNSISLEDYSASDLNGGLTESIEFYKIRSGGPRHLQQQASLVGHLRKLGVLPETKDSINGIDNIHFLEMGAGRGMLGLVAAGVASATTSRTSLTMVERAGTRSKADTVLRKAKEHMSGNIDRNNYMRLENLQWNRIQCDLAHVDVPSIIDKNIKVSAGEKRKSREEKLIVIIAKHLCGAGTDLALKSLRNIDADVCVMATCCHGVCSWKDYVGRDFLIAHFGGNFCNSDFELLRKWSAATVAVLSNANDADKEAEHPVIQTPEDDKVESGSFNVTDIVRALNLKCGIQGLGRACQRLLDAGRCDYMRKNIFPGETHDIRMCHYVEKNITPQNAVLLATRKKIRKK